LISATFVKPIDKAMIISLVNQGYTIVTIEDNVVHGGLGSSVLQYVNTLDQNIKVMNLGFNDEFIEHGSIDKLYELYGLDVQGIVKSIMELKLKE
jgi:1-deoxy-D-xylulose-5-phosphate synthase